MRPILSAQQMADSDAYTIQELGVPGIELMERAAQLCADTLLGVLRAGERTAVLVGSGNNGGDGLAISRLLLEAGFQVDTYLAFPDKPFTGDALLNYERLTQMQAPIAPLPCDAPLPQDYAWMVDALFGTGLSRPLAGRFAELVEHINGHPAQVLAVDMPSGLSGDPYQLIGPAVAAHITVTFHAPKYPHAVTPAADLCGRLVVGDIGISDHPAIQNPPQMCSAHDYRPPSRGLSGHKGTYGTLAVVGGFRGMEGAANLAALASLRFGAGKVRIYTNNPGPRFQIDSVMVAHAADYQPSYTARIIGPGLSRDPKAWALIDEVIASDPTTPTVWDADALHYLKHSARRPHPGDILTPHPGEAAALLGVSTGEVQADRVKALQALAALYPQAWVLLKGYRTLILGPGASWRSIGVGNPALATAGSGDVLSGMIGALLAQGCDAQHAVVLAALRHGMAGDHWVAHHPSHAMIAEDIIHDLTRRV